MDLNSIITAVFCLVDDLVRDPCERCRLRQRGPAPVADSEVLTIEAVGEFLRLEADRGVCLCRRHCAHLGGAPDHARAAGGEPLEGQGSRCSTARGVHPIAPTPSTPTGAWTSIDRMTDFDREVGSTGMSVLGVMGEAPSWTAPRRWGSPRASSAAPGTCR